MCVCARLCVCVCVCVIDYFQVWPSFCLRGCRQDILYHVQNEYAICWKPRIGMIPTSSSLASDTIHWRQSRHPDNSRFFFCIALVPEKKFTKPLRPKVCQYASVSIQITRAFITRLCSLFPITVTSHERHGGVLNHSPLTFLLRSFRLTRKPQSSYYCPFVRGIHRWSLYSLHKGQ